MFYSFTFFFWHSVFELFIISQTWVPNYVDMICYKVLYTAVFHISLFFRGFNFHFGCTFYHTYVKTSEKYGSLAMFFQLLLSL